VFRVLSKRGKMNFAEKEKLAAETEKAICREWIGEEILDGEEEMPARERR
jgi:hypothetical protein